MEEFTIQGEGDFIKISFEEVYGFPDKTCHWGGYDTRTTLQVKSGNYFVKGTLFTSTGELFKFLQQLKNCNEELSGSTNFISYEGNLELNVDYDNLGHIKISGVFSEYAHDSNELKFEFETDQTYMTKTISEIQAIADKYGDMKGIKK